MGKYSLFRLAVAALIALGATSAYAQGSETAASAGPAPSAKQIRKANHLLEKQIRRALVHVKGLDSTNVVVVARGGVVTLGGSVPDASQIPLAMSGAQRVSGVTEVRNSLQVRMPVP
ncbi:BON domain-containing protein [Paraburkholderia sp. B3]|uniref:BON domain-containing protein n=1 Tax=Paraburkholderia sp. B3 TaxID=3134791 RepID=UPI0039829D44